jgi:hypothetical protein
MSIFDLQTSKFKYELKFVLLSSLAHKCKEEFPDLINIPLADFLVDNTAP